MKRMRAFAIMTFLVVGSGYAVLTKKEEVSKTQQAQVYEEAKPVIKQMDKLDIWHKISSGLTEAGYKSRGVNSSLYSKDRVELDVYMEPSVSSDAKTQETIKQMVYKILEENKFQQKAFHVTIKFLPEKQAK
ncbi:hypothetical protein C3744_17060 [Priestia megaterium]|uniref:Uncharacterized protein n=1 Tax=Priestia megaterium TaxID=1404 RepID=A0A3D8X0J1_PRIMG|nr:hypothetical protein [Priestia megaterium]MDH3171643.1 hypothetical protein [Priestia megaterium]RDZ12990.1 hypothetical protein C3744_17060 [Priestia megaterium]